MAEYEKKVRKVLSENGFVFHRHGKGSHDIWINYSKKISVSVSTNVPSRHSANEILKEAGIKYKFN